MTKEFALRGDSCLRRKNSFFKNVVKNKTYLFMMLPGVLLLVVFNYLPMLGSLMAFKDTQTLPSM